MLRCTCNGILRHFRGKSVTTGLLCNISVFPLHLCLHMMYCLSVCLLFTHCCLVNHHQHDRLLPPHPPSPLLFFSKCSISNVSLSFALGPVNLLWCDERSLAVEFYAKFFFSVCVCVLNVGCSFRSHSQDPGLVVRLYDTVFISPKRSPCFTKKGLPPFPSCFPVWVLCILQKAFSPVSPMRFSNLSTSLTYRQEKQVRSCDPISTPALCPTSHAPSVSGLFWTFPSVCLCFSPR